jgi:hypothetical protein
MTMAQRGTLDECFSKAAFPAIKAGAAKRTGGVAVHRLLGQHDRPLLCIVLAYPGTFFDFAPCFGDRLAHLQRHDPRQFFGARAQPLCHRHKSFAALLERRLFPAQPGLMHPFNDFRNPGGIVFLENP